LPNYCWWFWLGAKSTLTRCQIRLGYDR
jgi:hypothetical protein